MWMTLISLFSEANFTEIVLTKFRDPKTTPKFDHLLEGLVEIVKCYYNKGYGLKSTQGRDLWVQSRRVQMWIFQLFFPSGVTVITFFFFLSNNVWQCTGSIINQESPFKPWCRVHTRAWLHRHNHLPSLVLVYSPPRCQADTSWLKTLLISSTLWSKAPR